MTNIDNPENEKIDLRTREGRALKAALRGDAARSTSPGREPEGQVPIRGLQRGEVLGRNGEILSRKRSGGGDPFAAADSLVPDGWEYQWCAISIIGNTEMLMDQNLTFAENGWRSVPAERYPGRFMPEGHKGSIIRGGQMLMERPKPLCDAARAEDLKLARQLISDRNESLKLTSVKKGMADGFEMGNRYRGTGGDVRISIDHGNDAPRPAHKIVE
jgi:hypothetical protein